MSDPQNIGHEEVSKVRAEQDPIDRVRQMLIDSGHATEETLKGMDVDVKAIVAEAAEYAQQSPEPDLWNSILMFWSSLIGE